MAIESADLEELLLLLLEDAVELFLAGLDGLAAIGELVLRELEHPLFFADVFVLLVECGFALVEAAFLLAQLVADAH